VPRSRRLFAFVVGGHNQEADVAAVVGVEAEIMHGG